MKINPEFVGRFAAGLKSAVFTDIASPQKKMRNNFIVSLQNAQSRPRPALNSIGRHLPATVAAVLEVG
jgi:hypothetical protein